MDNESHVRGVDPVRHLRDDALLGPIVERFGTLELVPADDFFSRFITSIIRQQVSIAAAQSIEQSLAESVEISPAAIRTADIATLRDAGLSGQKAETAHRVAQKFDDGEWRREQFDVLSNQDVIDELTTVHGVGVWTAKMQLMFSLGRPDIFPVEDLGIRRGMEIITDDTVSRSVMIERSERWAPVRSIASLYLWELTD